MVTNYSYTCYQKIISKSLQTLSPKNIISHHIYKYVMPLTKYILAIQFYQMYSSF
jgi:DNA-binding HxlR family transcriptional regulator